MFFTHFGDLKLTIKLKVTEYDFEVIHLGLTYFLLILL